MRKIQNQAELFIANGTISTHAPHGTAMTAGYTSVLEDGEVALVNVLTNTVHNAAFPTSGMYKFVARNGTQLLVSNVFDAATVTKTEKAYSAQTEQVDYIGYNTSTGELDESSAKNEIFTVHMYIKGLTRTDFNQAFVKEGHYITTTTSTSQFTLATGLVNSLIANFSRFQNPMIRFERVCDETTETALTGTGTMTFVYGSTIVNCATDSDAVLVAGDYIRTVTGVTGVVYKVSSLVSSGTTQTLTLDIPWQGADGTLADSVAVAIKAGDMAAGTHWGLKLTGIAQPYETQKYVGLPIMWDAVFTHLDANGKEETPIATVTNSVAPAFGNGTYAQVAEMERELQMGDGYQMYADIPSPTYRAQASSAKTYNLFNIKHTKNMTTHLGQEVPSLCEIVVAADTGLTYGTDQVTYTVAFSAGTKGNYSITAGGVVGYQAWNASTDTTHGEFVTNNGANFLLAGITVTYTSGSDTLNFVGSATALPSAPVLVNHSDGTDFGDFAATIAKTSVSGWIIWSSTDDAGSSL